MNKLLSLLSAVMCLMTAGESLGATVADYTAQPPFVTSGAPPLVMLVMGRDHKLYYEAYNDASDLNDDGVLDVRYNPSIDYYGYFDNFKCYTYNGTTSRFEPSSKTTNGKKCESAASDWSGDFLNYLTMSRMDTMRKVLYGGYRSTDTAGAGGETVLQRVYVPQDAHSWGKEYESVARDKYDIRDYTPLKLPEINTRHLFASTTLADNGNPLLRVLPNNSHRIWDWVAKERPVVDNSLEVTATGHYDSYPKTHAEYDSLVNQFASDAHQQGTGTPANGQINGSGNPYGDDDYYLNIFKGTIVVAAAGTYEFAVDGDDAVEVIIDGTVVASWYDGHGNCSCKDHKGSIALTSGNHSVEFRHQERAGGDNYYLYWKGADSSNNWQLVPAAKFTSLIQTTYDVNYLGSRITDYQVRVKVCDPAISLEANCKQYPSGNYKPVGILQRHGESLWDATAAAYKAPKMYFGLMTGSYAKSTSGGVLRKKMGNISDEIETNTTGVFKTTTNGIIQTINKMRIYGFSYPSAGNYEYNKNCGWITSGPMTEGQCRDWGNPIGEVMYEAVRYFAGKKAATSNFDYVTGSANDDDSQLGLPKATWNNPYDTTDSGFASCSKPFMLVLSDINPSYDSDQLPGVDTNFGAGIASDLSALNVTTSATTISTMEGISGNKFIGQSGADANGVCSVKNIAGLGSIRGLCPEEPTKLGSYYSASVAHYGHTTDLQTRTDQKITTYGIGLASPLPRIELKVGPNRRLVTLVPFGKSVKQDSSGLWTYFPTNTIVDFFVEELTDTYGKFSINYEDVEQGADHDMDCIVRYEYQLVDGSGNNVTDPISAAKVKITLTSTYAAGGIVQHLGYVISGTTADGTYVEVRDLDTSAGNDVHASFDTGSAVAPLPLTATRIFEPSSVAGATAAQLLPNPLWYAAKWGAYEEKDDTTGPNLQEEWDKDHDGIPDTYFYVTNPLKLEEQLNKSFADILRRTSSATAASVISGSRSGEGAVYQSIFYPEFNDYASPRHTISWAGSVHASFIDEYARMREDTNHNGVLDLNDKIFVFRKKADNTTAVDKYNIVLGVKEITTVSLPAAASLMGDHFFINNVSEHFYVWFTVDGAGVDPKPLHDGTGIAVALLASDTSETVATKTAAILNAFGAFNVPSPTTNTITITGATQGDTPDATAGTSGAAVTVTQQGAGETTILNTTGNVEDINYLWNSNSYLNTISDTDVVNQRTYSSPTPGRYIFTFIDADRDMIADDNEQKDFVASSNPTVLNLADASTIFPYIPVSSDSETLPSYVSTTGGNKNNFLQNQTKRVIDYIRGKDQGAFTLTDSPYGTIPAFRSRKIDTNNDGTLETWRLGDIVHSSPTVVSKSFAANHLLYRDTSYAIFAAKYANRRTVVYTGANDGMLHAFNGGFYEDRFDVFQPTPDDHRADAQFLTQPKNKNGNVITSGFAAHPLGAELWAYIPYNLLPHLYWLTEPNYSHAYYVDLKPRLFEAKIFTPELSCATNPNDSACIHPGGWGTVLVGGMRFGGGKINVDMNRTDGTVNSDDRAMTSAYFILDVTNPEAPPKVLGELSFPHLGYTTSYPTVATFKDKVEKSGSPNAWYLIFGSGPAEADGSPGTKSGKSLSEAISQQTAKLYVVDLVAMASDKVLKTLDTSGTLSSSSPYYYKNFTGERNAFISDPITVDINLDYKTEAVYFGTVSYALTGTPALPEWGGKLRRVVMNNDANPGNWVGDSILIDLETTHHQPITAAPTVGLDPNDNTWIFFGTGRYFVRDDATITDQQAYYGIKEPRVVSSEDPTVLKNSYTTVTHADMYDSTTVEVDATTHLVSGGEKPDGTSWTNAPWKTFLSDVNSLGGWYYNFTHTGERNVSQAALYADILTFTSYIPSDDICAYEGSSFLYPFYYLTGSAPYKRVIRDVNNPDPTYNLKMISLGTGFGSKPSIHTGRNDGSTVVVQKSDGTTVLLQEENPGQTKSGKTSWEDR